MSTTKHPTGRGGPGRGQGRKELPPNRRRRPLSVRLPPDLIDWLDEQTEEIGLSRAQIVERALRERQMRGR